MYPQATEAEDDPGGPTRIRTMPSDGSVVPPDGRRMRSMSTDADDLEAAWGPAYDATPPGSARRDGPGSVGLDLEQKCAARQDRLARVVPDLIDEELAVVGGIRMDDEVL
jgi:hypothetical protein